MIKINFSILFFITIALNLHAMEMNPIVFKTKQSEIDAAIKGMHKCMPNLPAICFALANRNELATLLPLSQQNSFIKDMNAIALIAKTTVWDDQSDNYAKLNNVIKSNRSALGSVNGPLRKHVCVYLLKGELKYEEGDHYKNVFDIMERCSVVIAPVLYQAVCYLIDQNQNNNMQVQNHQFSSSQQSIIKNFGFGLKRNSMQGLLYQTIVGNGLHDNQQNIENGSASSFKKGSDWDEVNVINTESSQTTPQQDGQAEIYALKNQNLELTTQITGLQNENKDAQDKISELQEWGDQIRAKLVEAKEENERLTAELLTVQSALEVQKVCCEKLKTGNKELQTKKLEDSETIMTLQSQKEHLEFRLRVSGETISQLEEQNNKISTELTNAKEENAKLQGQVQELKQQIDPVTTENETLKKQAAELIQENEAKSTSMQELTKQLEEAKQKNNELNKENEKVTLEKVTLDGKLKQEQKLHGDLQAKLKLLESNFIMTKFKLFISIVSTFGLGMAVMCLMQTLYPTISFCNI